ncbi:VOC family protein [Spirochaeta cellobiosiphila]
MVTTINGLDFFSLQVFDLDKSKEFYTEVIGFDTIPQSPPQVPLD